MPGTELGMFFVTVLHYLHITENKASAEKSHMLVNKSHTLPTWIVASEVSSLLQYVEFGEETYLLS